jgi:hypothetical protein
MTVQNRKEEDDYIDYLVMKNDISCLESTLFFLEDLEEFVQIGDLSKDINQDKFDYWSEGGVVVSSENIASSKGSDYTLITNTPRPVVWLLANIRDICVKYFEFVNGFNVLLSVAKNAEKYLNKNPFDIEQQIEFFLSNLARVKSKVSDLSKKLENDMPEGYDSRLVNRHNPYLTDFIKNVDFFLWYTFPYKILTKLDLFSKQTNRKIITWWKRSLPTYWMRRLLIREHRCIKKLRYKGSGTIIPGEKCSERFFKVGSIYIGKTFNGATYTIEGYVNDLGASKRIGYLYFKIVE